MPTTATPLKLDDEKLKSPELYKLSLFGSHHSIISPKDWKKTKPSPNELLGEIIALSPRPEKEPSPDLRHLAIPIPIKLYSNKNSFYGIYIKLALEGGQEFMISDFSPEKVNLEIEHSMVKAVEGTVGGTTPIGITASLKGALTWTDSYTISKPLITGMPFGQTIYWQFEKQKAQGLPTGEFTALLVLKSPKDFNTSLKIEVTAFDDRPKDENSDGITERHTINLKRPADKPDSNLHHQLVDNYLFGKFQTIKMLTLLSHWSSLKIDATELLEISPPPPEVP